MKSSKIIISVSLLSTLLLTACNKDSLTEHIDIDYSSDIAFYGSTSETASSDGLSSMAIEMEAAITAKKYDCDDTQRLENSSINDYRSLDCISHHMARGTAYGLSEEFGHVKAELTIKYQISYQQITGQILLHLGPNEEILSVTFRGPMSTNNSDTMSRFRALSSHSFRDKYFTGFVEINNLVQLLDPNGQQDIPIVITGVFD